MNTLIGDTDYCEACAEVVSIDDTDERSDARGPYTVLTFSCGHQVALGGGR